MTRTDLGRQLRKRCTIYRRRRRRRFPRTSSPGTRVRQITNAQCCVGFFRSGPSGGDAAQRSFGRDPERLAAVTFTGFHTNIRVRVIFARARRDAHAEQRVSLGIL